MMHKAHRIRLYPTAAQANYFARACGTARFAWNWALARWKEIYAKGGKPNWMAINKELNAIKRTQFPWMADVTKHATESTLKHLGAAFDRFFKGLTKYPKLKKKGVSRDSFTMAAPKEIRAGGKRIRLPVIGWVKMAQEVRFAGRLLRATVSREADCWFVSVLVKMPLSSTTCENQAVIGVDLGISAMATCSDGAAYPNPMPLRKHLRKLKRLSKRLSRKAKGSKNRAKAKMRLARLHMRIGNVRRDALHKATTAIVRSAGTIVLEDLNVRGMMANEKLARAVSDVGMHEFRRQIEYKAAWAGATVLCADRFFPSTKRCSRCGNVKSEMALSERTYHCEKCGLSMGRDANAAANLAALAVPAGRGEFTPLETGAQLLLPYG